MPRHADLSPPVLLTVKQSAEYLSLSIGAMYELCRANKIRHHRMGVDGGTIRIAPDALDEYLLDCTREPATAEPAPTVKLKRRRMTTAAQRAGLKHMDIPNGMRA